MTMLLTESPWSDSFIFLLIFTIVVGILLYYYFFHENPKTIPEGDGWWGARERQDTQEDETVHSFTIETFEEMIQDLHYRLDHTRFTPPLEDSRFQYGFNSNYLRKVVSYWRKDYNWKKQLEILNQFPHFRTRIEGQTAIPLMMIHGWPGSFYEFYKIIPQLTDPVSHSLSQQETFEIICPSIPGYGFSEAPHKKGFNSIAAARVFCKLMRRLGFDRFYVQGGDWGSLIATNMAQMKPQNVKGIHLNFFPNSRMGLKILPSLLLGRYAPALFGFTQTDVERMYPFIKKNVYDLLKESGYMHIQGTKPDSLGCALNDSPVGLAAYILEKFSTWTNKDFRDLEDGGLTRKFSLDELLTNVMIYWVSGSITSSMRLYKENLGADFQNRVDDKVGVYVPVGMAAFPNELIYIPLAWARQKYKKIMTFSYMSCGGHFAAFEEPDLLAEDLRNFVQTVEKSS
ncbi:epoxide hydrolase 1-like isoform X2 [Stegostoma tigrinum]|uniref:epoxide hydrolase 1-like isoform X2 n=1 Tax=Stegostoma tigrinum TaxID=3053191 RepID=UPI0028702103|nr:epoxide hydrolase 1-like isoform X2 [Stegostoma tigrinum]